MGMYFSHFLPFSLFHLIFNVLSDDCEGVGMMWVMPFSKHRILRTSGYKVYFSSVEKIRQWI